jgi:hypothetical protein
MIARAWDRLLELILAAVVMALLYAYLRRRSPPN